VIFAPGQTMDESARVVKDSPWTWTALLAEISTNAWSTTEVVQKRVLTHLADSCAVAGKVLPHMRITKLVSMRTNALLEITSAHNFAETAKEVITVNATRDTESELIGSLVKTKMNVNFQRASIIANKPV